MRKVVTVVGARPNFVKASAISEELEESKVKEIIIHTGQHFSPEMSDTFFDELNIPYPTYNLDIHSLPHGAMTGRMLEKIESILMTEEPDCVIVYGDTNSTLAGALAASKVMIPVVHIESGVRSFNMSMPEEINRILVDKISNIRCCVSDEGIRNLELEGLDSGNLICGDVMYDVFLKYKDIAIKRNSLPEGFKKNEYGLVTIHRQENTNDIILYSILLALSEIPFNFIFPVHPRIKKFLEHKDFKNLLNKGNIKLISPVGYIDMLNLELNAKMIITDSGGVQREAYYSHVPSLILRNESEWVELIREGYATLVGVSTNVIKKGFDNVMLSNITFEDGLYGNGYAAKNIVDQIDFIWG